MKYILYLSFLLLNLPAYADKQDPLHIDTNSDLKFSLKEQQSWTETAIIEYEDLKSNTSLKIKKRLTLIFSSDLNKDGSIDETEKRLIRGRLASICSYYEQVFENYFNDGTISTYNLNRIQYKYPDMIPGYDLEDPFIEKTKISRGLSPVYF